MPGEAAAMTRTWKVGKRRVTMTAPQIRINMVRPDTQHPDKRRRHQGRASCQVVDRRFEAKGPAPIYRLVTLLWLHGHRGNEFEVWDDLSPFGIPAVWPCAAGCGIGPGS